MEESKIYKAIFKVNHADGSGSCFYLKKQHVFVTNYHVVKGFQRVAIQDNEKNPYLAQVILVNMANDIALLRAEGDFSSLPDLQLADGDNLMIGNHIKVAGYPLGLPFTVTEGSISSTSQLLDNQYYIQTDAAVNPGNSGGPMLNEQGELIAVTVSKISDADNMGFGIPVSLLKKTLESADLENLTGYHVLCNSCDSLLDEYKEYCPSCGNRFTENHFKEMGLTDLAKFCEEAIRGMGVDPILARIGHEAWRFHVGSSEIRLFVHSGVYLCCNSPINTLPKKELEPLLRYLLGGNVLPYKLGIMQDQIWIEYSVHTTDIFSDHSEQIKGELTNLAFQADMLDNFLADTYKCELSKYAKVTEV